MPRAENPKYETQNRTSKEGHQKVSSKHEADVKITPPSRTEQQAVKNHNNGACDQLIRPYKPLGCWPHRTSQ